MYTLDTVFPNPEDCYFALFQDAVYEHDNSINYAFEKNNLICRNRVAVIKKIEAMIDLVYEHIAAKDESFRQYRPTADYIALWEVVARYSRDIYNVRRLSAKLQKAENDLVPAQQRQLTEFILDGIDNGGTNLSGNLYIHKQAAVLLYWFSAIKPFHLGFAKEADPAPNHHIMSYFNEYFAYCLINIALSTLGVNFTIHKNSAYFFDLLYQLHYRNLSRSSIELLLQHKGNANVDSELFVERGKVAGIGMLQIQKIKELEKDIPMLHFIVIESKKEKGIFVATCISVRVDGYGKTPNDAAQDMLKNVCDFLYINFTHPKCKSKAWENLDELSRLDDWSNELWAAYKAVQFRFSEKGISLLDNFYDDTVIDLKNENRKLKEENKKLKEQKVRVETENVFLRLMASNLAAQLADIEEMKVKRLAFSNS